MGERRTKARTGDSIETGRRISLALDHAGRNQKDLADALHVSNPTVHDWVTGEVTPRPHRLVGIAEYTGTSVDYLLLRDEKMDRDVASKLTRIGLELGRDRIDHLSDLPGTELRRLVDEHELQWHRERTRLERERTAKTIRKSKG